MPTPQIALVTTDYNSGHLAPIIAAALAGASIFALVTALGFSWWEGFQHTRNAYRSGIANERPYTYFVIANLAVTIVWLGPAVLAALAHRQQPRVSPLVLCALGGLLFADVTGLSKGEVERIWIPFIPGSRSPPAGCPTA